VVKKHPTPPKALVFHRWLWFGPSQKNQAQCDSCQWSWCGSTWLWRGL